MNEEAADLNTAEEPVDAEWGEGDPRWSQDPVAPDPDGPCGPRLFGRGECPFVPTGKYLILWVKPIEFFSRQGLIVPTQTGGPGGYQCPILTVIDAGPEATRYRRGDTVVANPRNAEVTYEWSDPEGLGTEHFLFVNEDNIIGLIDQEVVGQFSIRAQRVQREQTQRLTDMQRSEAVGLSVPDEKVILGPSGVPAKDD